MNYKIKLYHLYPDAMNLYGDLGNVICLQKRCEWRNFDFEVVNVKIGDKVDFKDADIIYMGGGQDRGQRTVSGDLKKRGGEIKEFVEKGLPVLTICGGFQLFGKHFRTINGEEIPGIEVFDIQTVGGEKRLIGNVTVDASRIAHGWAKRDSNKGESEKILVGFENHSGVTTLGVKTEPLGKIVRGYGNKGDGTYEGGWYKNAFGTYLHGSLLPKNPWFADQLIKTALFYRYNSIIPLENLDDSLENLAHDFAIERAKTAKTLSI